MCGFTEMSTEHDIFSVSNKDKEKASWKGGAGADRSKGLAVKPRPWHHTSCLWRLLLCTLLTSMLGKLAQSADGLKAAASERITIFSDSGERRSQEPGEFTLTRGHLQDPCVCTCTGVGGPALRPARAPLRPSAFPMFPEPPLSPLLSGHLHSLARRSHLEDFWGPHGRSLVPSLSGVPGKLLPATFQEESRTIVYHKVIN